MENFKTRRRRYRAIAIFFGSLFAISALLAWSITSIRSGNSKVQLSAEQVINFCESLFEENIVRSETTADELNQCNDQLSNLDINEPGTNTIRDKLFDAMAYYDWLAEANNWLDEAGIVKSSLQEKDLAALKESLKSISELYQPMVTDKFAILESEHNRMDAAISAINNLFTSVDKTSVRTDATRDEYNSAKQLVDELKQEDLKQNLSQYLEQVLPIIEEQERIAEEAYQAWLAAEAERRAREEAERARIAAAWVRLNIPYVSQNYAEVYNGCEAATLLMSLKYKGLLGGMDLRTFASNIPRSDNPETGFFQDIFSLEPRGKAHWIAPQPLANYGASYTGGAVSIINATGWSIDQLDSEVAAGNPVIIYLTFGFKEPSPEYHFGVPKNLHVLVLNGYNSITGDQSLIDPWTYPSGNYNFTLSKGRTEYLYAASGYRALVVR